MTITIHINKCNDCKYSDHSGAFTPGGAKPVCHHRDTTKKRKLPIYPGDTAKDVLVRGGMTDESAEEYVQKKSRDSVEKREFEDAVLCRNGEYHHWIHWALPDDWSIPDWCPLRHGGKY